jgi:DNA-binding transcriptional LysR family regulator
MELRHLRSFRIAAELEHFGRAARQLHVSQPALSQQIADLERALGAALFTRTTRGVRLTPAGQHFAARVETLLHDLDTAVDETRAIGRAAGQVIRLGVPEGKTAVQLTTAVMAQLLTAHPAVRIEVSGVPWLEQAQAILDRRLDAGFIWTAGAGVEPATTVVPAGLDRVRLHHDDARHALMSSDNALVSVLARTGAAATLQSLREVPFMLFAQRLHPPLYDAIRNAVVQGGGRAPQEVEGVSATAGATPLLQLSRGWTLVTDSLIPEVGPSMRCVPIDGFSFRCGLDLVWRERDERPEVQALVEQARRLADPPA